MASKLDIYANFFGLKERPFTLVPDPDFLFWTTDHNRAYTMLEFGLVSHAPITLITGEIGAGKTTLIHQLLRSIGSDMTVGLVSNTQGDRNELLRWILLAYGLEAKSDETYVDLFARFQNFLISEYSHGKNVVLIFDEAQNLSVESLEELRMFTNINANKDELLQVIVCGQPELRTKVKLPELTQFAQRVAASYHLPCLNLSATRDYVRHRLEVAGAQGRNIFEQAAIDIVFTVTGGVPRSINQLCDLSMVYAFSEESQTVTDTIVIQVLSDGVYLGFDPKIDNFGAGPSENQEG